MGVFLIALTVLGSGCAVRHCSEFYVNRDDVHATLCEAKCRCLPSESTEPIKLP